MDGAYGRLDLPRGANTGKLMPNKGKTALHIVEAPETQRFNSPLPAAGNDTRKPATKLGKFHDMTAKGGAGTKRSAEMVDMADMDDDDDDDEDGGGKRKFSNKRNATSTGRRKIDIEYIEDKSKRHVSFTKRKAGLMKKAYELSTLTGTNCLVLVVSETGLVYTYATPGLKPVIAHEDGKAVIAASLRGDLKIDDDDLPSSAPAKPRKSVPKSKSASTEPEEPEQYEMMERDLEMPTSHVRGQPHHQEQQQHHPVPLTLPDMNHLQQQQHHQMFGDDNMMDPSLRYMNDFDNLFPVSSNAGSLPGLINPSLPPLPFSAVAEATNQAYTLPPFRPPMTAEASTSQQPMHDQSRQPQSQPALAYHPTQTAFDRAQAEHAQAFASYQAKTQTPYVGGRPAPSIASHAGGTHGQPLHGAHEFGDEARNWLPNLIKEKEAPIVSGPNAEVGMEERRKAWRVEAEQALQSARQDRNIQTFIHAHSLSHKANLAIPPPRNSTRKPTGGIELTLEHFRVMCEGSKIDALDFLGPASKAFMDTYLPQTLSYTPKMLNEAQQHLCLFYDYLESHDLISSKEYYALSNFDSPSAMLLSASRVAPVAEQAASRLQYIGGGEDAPRRVQMLDVQLKLWIEVASEKFEKAGRFAAEVESAGPQGVASVEGWFEVYRIRKSFALLKERELLGDATIIRSLSPFKVRLPSAVTELLKSEDALWLKLRRVLPRDDSVAGRTARRSDKGSGGENVTWAPVQTGPFQPSLAESLDAESDIDVDSFSAELDSMLLAKAAEARTEEDEMKIREHREVLGMLERARDRLAEGELSDE